MPEKPADTTTAHQVELVISRLDSLSILPCVATKFLSQLSQFQLTPSSLTELIESDPALTVKIFSTFHRQGLSFTNEAPSVRRALDELSLRLIRDTFLSVKVHQDFGQDNDKTEFRKQLTLHSLAVACCAEDIAEIILPEMSSQIAYLAGLLHDIGKLALDQVMPKSFVRIVEEAKSQNSSICAIERKHLGTDHTVLGKRLARKWHLPDEITLAIWLHHSNTGIISQSIPEAKIARIVQLADCIARQCGIGRSGSFDSPDLPGLPAISPEQLQQIHRDLPGRAEQKSKVLGLDLPKQRAAYCEVVQAAAAQLAQDNTKLSSENLRLQISSNHFDFIADFLSSINSAATPIEVAENSAVRWQKSYQTGQVCLYLAPPPNSQVTEAVVIESRSKTKTIILNTPAETAVIPQTLVNDFTVLNADERIDWLFEQLDVDFDLSRTKLLPLISKGSTIGAIVFELCYQAETEKLRKKFEAPASVVAAALDMALARQKQQHYAEQFAMLITEPDRVKHQIRTDSALTALAEMAAGAAHELNNPLSVISGRAQLLAGDETDAKKKRILEQIQENADGLSEIVDCLMSFARPRQPKPTMTNIEQILDEAVHLAARKENAEQPDIQLDVANVNKNVLVDSAQIASAIANIFSNSLESYTDGTGPIKVTADEAGDFVKLEIIDLGCGMDAETLQKSTQPFFSAKPAGRKRGMGLASAQRIIQLNNGSLNIKSQPNTGTTVTILLPCK